MFVWAQNNLSIYKIKELFKNYLDRSLSYLQCTKNLWLWPVSLLIYGHNSNFQLKLSFFNVLFNVKCLNVKYLVISSTSYYLLTMKSTLFFQKNHSYSIMIRKVYVLNIFLCMKHSLYSHDLSGIQIYVWIIYNLSLYYHVV